MEGVMVKKIVVGLGNPILGNDGVGWKVAEEVEKRLPADSGVEVEFFSLGGISLMERLVGYDEAVVVDALQSREARGKVVVLSLEELPNYSALHATSIHDTSLQDAFILGRKMGAQLPERVSIVGVTTEQSFDFGESLTPDVQAAVRPAAEAALKLLGVLT